MRVKDKKVLKIISIKLLFITLAWTNPLLASDKIPAEWEQQLPKSNLCLLALTGTIRLVTTENLNREQSTRLARVAYFHKDKKIDLEHPSPPFYRVTGVANGISTGFSPALYDITNSLTIFVRGNGNDSAVVFHTTFLNRDIETSVTVKDSDLSFLKNRVDPVPYTVVDLYGQTVNSLEALKGQRVDILANILRSQGPVSQAENTTLSLSATYDIGKRAYFLIERDTLTVILRSGTTDREFRQIKLNYGLLSTITNGKNLDEVFTFQNLWSRGTPIPYFRIGWWAKELEGDQP